MECVPRCGILVAEILLIVFFTKECGNNSERASERTAHKKEVQQIYVDSTNYAIFTVSHRFWLGNIGSIYHTRSAGSGDYGDIQGIARDH